MTRRASTKFRNIKKRLVLYLMDLCVNFQISTIQEFNIFHINLSIHRAQLFLATNYHVCVCIEIWYRLRNEVQMQGEKTSETVSRAERESTTASEVSLCIYV